MSSTTSSTSNNIVLPTPELKQLREGDYGRTTCTLTNTHVSVANAMRRTLLSQLPVIGIPFEPYSKNKVEIFENSTNETDQTLWYRIGNIPIHSLNPSLVTDYCVTLDVSNDNGNEVRIVTTSDMNLEKLETPINTNIETSTSTTTTTTTKKIPIAYEYGRNIPINKNEIFPVNKESNDFIAIAELYPPISKNTLECKKSVLKLRATFEWVKGSGAFAPNIVSYQNTQNINAANEAWKQKEIEIRETYEREAAEIVYENSNGANLPEMRYSIEKTVSDAKHDFMLTTAKMYYYEDQFDFMYEIINTAYTFRRAWRQAGGLIKEQLEEILSSIHNDTLEYWPAGTAASHGRISVTSNKIIGGFGFDIILPNIDHTLGPVIAYAMNMLCFVRNEEEAYDSDRLNFCAFHQFTPDDNYGVIRISLVKNESSLIPIHVKTACGALVDLFTKIIEIMHHD